MSGYPVEHLDSPNTTSAIQYSIDIGGYNTSYAVYVNRNHSDTDQSTYIGSPISTVTLTEIGG